MDDFEVRHLKESDIPDALELMRESLGETALLRRTPALFRWKHLQNPAGRSIMLVAEADDRLIGLRTFMRWRLELPGGGELQCVRPVDTATHPDYRRLGIFKTLTEAAVTEARADGVHLIFNTPNPQSGAGYLKMGWTQVGPIGVLARPKLGLVKRRDTLNPSRTVDIDAEPVRPDRLPAWRSPLGLRTPRTTAYLTWRFNQHPTADYRMIMEAGGLAIVRPNSRHHRSELLLCDMAGDIGPRVARAVVRRPGFAYVAAWFSRGTPERAASIKAGIIPLPRVVALTLFARALSPMEVNVASLSSWDLALSDLEML